MTVPATAGMRARTRWWLLVAAHVPLLMLPTVITAHVGGQVDPLAAPTTTALIVVAAAAVCALQVRHALAAARGARPRGWQWTTLAIAVLAYLPLIWLGPSWIVAEWALVASVVLLLPARISLPLGALIVLMSKTSLVVAIAQGHQLTPAQTVWAAVSNTAVAVLGAAALVAATHLVEVLDDLAAARAALARAAVDRERLRIYRDLHDVLGQSLSAISLKGELAIRLWHRDRTRAVAEVESLAVVARATATDIRAVTFDRRPASLGEELVSATRLLHALGISTDIEVVLGDPERLLDEALGWALREGVANILSHSAATWIGIRGCRTGGRIRLEIVNDGVRGGGAPGSGLAGLAARLRPLGGVVSARPVGSGRHFRLAIELPGEPPRASDPGVPDRSS